MYLCDFFAPAIVTDNLLRWNHLFTWPITPTESEQLVPGTGAVPDVHGAPSTWLNLRFMKAATPNPKLVRSGPASRLVTSSSTHLLEAVLVPSIIITRIVTGEVSGVDLEETEEISSLHGSEAGTQTGPPLPCPASFSSVQTRAYIANPKLS